MVKNARRKTGRMEGRSRQTTLTVRDSNSFLSGGNQVTESKWRSVRTEGHHHLTASHWHFQNTSPPVAEYTFFIRTHGTKPWVIKESKFRMIEISQSMSYNCFGIGVEMSNRKESKKVPTLNLKCKPHTIEWVTKKHSTEIQKYYKLNGNENAPYQKW